MSDTAPSSYPFVPLPDRGPLRFPNGARVALIVTINIEYWEQDRPGQKEPLFPGGPATIPHVLPGDVLDTANWTWREYGQRVGVWRVFDVCDKLGVPLSMVTVELPTVFNAPNAMCTGGSITNSGSNLSVTINYNTPPCTAANPTVSISPLTNNSVQAGSPYNFTVTVQNNDSIACASRTFSLSSSLPSDAGWGSVFSPTSLTIGPGASANATLTKTPPITALGSYSGDATG